MSWGVRGNVVAVVVLAVLVLGGCGGGSEPTAETAPPLTKPQLVKKLGAVCQEHSEDQVEALERFDKKHGIPYGVNREKVTDPQIEKELVVVILPIVRDTIQDIKQKLNPNARQKPTLEAFLEALEYGVRRSAEDPSWLATGDWEPFRRARLLSWKLGTALCGQA